MLHDRRTGTAWALAHLGQGHWLPYGKSFGLGEGGHWVWFGQGGALRRLFRARYLGLGSQIGELSVLRNVLSGTFGVIFVL